MVSVVQISDLHHGFSTNTAKRLEKFLMGINEAEKEDFVLLVSGDLISTRQESFKKCVRLLRRVFPETDILIVRGNHDFYDFRVRYGDELKLNPKWSPSLDKLLIRHKEIVEESNIILLEPGVEYVRDNVVFLGFDGWHYDPEENSRLVYNRSGKKTYECLLEKAKTDLDKILEFDTSSYRKSVLLTHFPPYECNKEDPSVSQERYLPLTQKFDWIFCGHTHEEYEEEANGCRIINSGCGAQVTSSGRIVEQWKYKKFNI